MQLLRRSILIMLLLGLMAGVFGGLLGIGGGVIIVPGLVFFFGLTQHKAHGTSLAVALMLSLAGVIGYAIRGHLDLFLAVEMAVGAIIGATIGAKVAGGLQGRVLRMIFSLFIAAVGIRMMFGGFMALCGSQDGFAAASWAGDGVIRAAIVAGVGAAAGFASSLLGIGGGMVMVPAMVLLLCVPQKMAQGVSLAVMTASASTGMLMHHGMGNVEFYIANWVGLGAVVGALVGSSIAAIVDATHLKLIFGGFLLVMAILMGLKKGDR